MNGGHEQDVWYDWNDMQIRPLVVSFVQEKTGPAKSPRWRRAAAPSRQPGARAPYSRVGQPLLLLLERKQLFFFVYQWDYSPMPKRCMTKSSIYDGNRKFGKKKKKSPLASNKENASAVLRHPPHFRRQITFLDTKKLIGKWPCVSRCVCAERINSHFRFHPFHRSEVLCVYILKAPPFFPLSLCTSPVAGFIFISSGSLEHFSLKCWQPSNTRELSIHRNICRVRSWLDCIKRWIGSTSHARPPLSFSLSLSPTLRECACRWMLRMKRASGGGGGGGCCLNGGSRLDQYLIGKRQQQQQWRPIHARRPCGRDFSLRSRIAWAAGLHWSIPTETAAHRRGARASTPTLCSQCSIHSRAFSFNNKKKRKKRSAAWVMRNQLFLSYFRPRD